MRAPVPDLYRDRVKDRWRDILPQLGIPPEFLTGKHQPCPMCGGKDRARFTNHRGNGSFICTHCGSGDGVALVMQINNWDFKEAKRHIDLLIGASHVDRPKPQKSDAARRQDMNAMWRAAKPVTLADPVGRYLSRRCRLTEFPPCLRFAKRLRYWGDDAQWFPAMLAMVSDPDGKPAILHRTYLTDEGEKAPLDNPRRLMPGAVPKGSAIRLQPATDELGIAEGIETALSAAALSGVPVWATISTGIMAGWMPPAHVKKITIFGDCDNGYGGQATAYALAYRLIGLKLSVTVEVPGHCTTGYDWNDMHMRTPANT